MRTDCVRCGQGDSHTLANDYFCWSCIRVDYPLAQAQRLYDDYIDKSYRILERELAVYYPIRKV